MKIIYLGQEIDPTIEHDLRSNNEFGFKIDIKYTDDCWLRGNTDTAYNCTQFHWRYTDLFNPVPSNRVAFESDIHNTGFTKEVSVIEYVGIKIANELYDSY